MEGSWTAKALRVELGALRLPMGLVVDEACLETAVLRVDLDSRAVSLQAPGRLVARLSERSLTDFLESQSPAGLESFEVKLQEGKIVATAIARVILPIRGGAVCTLRIEEERRLALEVQELDVPSVARGLVEAQLAKLNPLLDVANLPVPLEVRLETVMIDAGWIELRGRVENSG